MSDEELYSLYHSGEQGKIVEAKEGVFKKYDHYVGYVMTRMYATYAPLIGDDLMQAGRLALLRALETYDPKKGKFTTHCTCYIKQEMSREIAFYRHEKSPYFVGLQDQVRKIISECEENRIVPTESLVAKLTGWTLKKAKRELVLAFTTYVSLNDDSFQFHF